MRVLRGLNGALAQFVGAVLKVTFNSGGYLEIGGKRFFFLDTAITGDTTTVPTTAPAGAIGFTTHATGASLIFISDGTKWQEYGGE